MLGKLQHISYQMQQDKPLLRCLFGVSFALILATALSITAPQLSAIFSLLFLGKGKEKLSLKKSIFIFIVFVVLGSVGNYLGKYLIDYPLVLTPILALITFWSYRLTKIPEPVRLLFLMFTFLLSFVSIQANFLGEVILSVLLLHLTIALAVAQVSYLLFANETLAKKEEKKATQKKYKNINADKLAFNGLLVILPVLIVFYTFNLNVLPLTLVFIVVLGFDPFIYQSKKGTALIIGNLFGGLVGVLAYNILVIAPSFLIYIFLTFTIGGYFVTQLFSDKKNAPIFDLAFKTFFVVMGTISVSDTTAGSTVFERLLQICLAIIYVVLAFKVVNTFNNPKK